MAYGIPERARLARAANWVVGASATGVQIAAEIRRSGRERARRPWASTCEDRDVPARDIHWWMEAAGVLDERYNEVDDIVRARRVPSMQLAGTPERATFDLNVVEEHRRETDRSVRLGRPETVALSQSSQATSASWPTKLARLLTTIDEWATEYGLDYSTPASHRLLTEIDPALPLTWISTVVRSRPSSGQLASVRTTPGRCARRGRQGN